MKGSHGLRVLGDLVRTAGLATLAVWLIVAGGMFGSLLWVHIWWVYESPDQTLRVVVSVSFGVVVGLVGGWHGHAWWARRRPGPPVRSLDPAGGPPRPAAPGEGHEGTPSLSIRRDGILARRAGHSGPGRPDTMRTPRRPSTHATSDSQEP